MWIGSYNGLYKHEGAVIKPFVITGKGKSDISGLEMHSVLEDRLGFIWTGTTNGLDKINPYTYEITHYPIRNKDSKSSFVGYIYSVFQDDEDYLWICTDVALYRMNYTTGDYSAIPVNETKNGILAINVGYNTGIKTGKGIWISTYNGMVYYEYASREFYHRYHNPDHNPVFNLLQLNGKRSQSDMETDSKGNIWFVANPGVLACYNWKTNKLDTFSFQHPATAWYCCYSVKTDGHGNVWIGFRQGGLLHFDVRTKKFTTVIYKGRNSLISSNYIYSLERDYKGDIWVATDNGIDVINYYNQTVLQRQLSSQPDFTNLLYISGESSFDGNQSLFIPFQKFGFLKYNIKADSVEVFTAGNGEFKGANYIIPGKNNYAWASRSGQLVQVNLGTGQITSGSIDNPLLLKAEKFSGDIIWYWQQNNHSVYVRKSSPYLLHITNDTIEVMQCGGFKPNVTISSDSSSIWYLNLELNLVKKSLLSGQADTVLLQEKLKQVDFSFSNPRHIADDGESIWMTGQNGLLRYNYKTNTIKPYTVKEGLSHTTTYSLVTDNANRVWAASIGGVDVYDSSGDLFRPAISFPASTYMDAFGSALKISEGRLAFHAGNKVFLIQPDAFFKGKKQGQLLQIQEVQVNGNSIDLTDTKLLSDLKYNQNRLLVRFALLDFEQLQGITYWYKLTGSSDDWVSNGKNTELIFNELQPGRYTLQIKATDASNHVISKEASITLNITPPFWKTWWFRLLLAAAAAGIIYYFFRRRVKSVKDKADIQQQITELESKALRAQMNPHFIFNSLNAIQELIVTNKVTEGYQYLSSFSKLLRMVLNHSEKNLIRLSDEIETIQLQLSLEALRFKNAFSYSVTVGDNIEAEMINVPPLLLQPYVENAVWHGLRHKEGDKGLWVRIKEKGQQLEIEIEDNGVGRARSAEINKQKLGLEQFESKGSALSGQRIKLLASQYPDTAAVYISDIKDENGEAAGTIVKIVLPSNLKYYEQPG